MIIEIVSQHNRQIGEWGPRINQNYYFLFLHLLTIKLKHFDNYMYPLKDKELKHESYIS